MEVKIINEKKGNNISIVGKLFICRIQLFKKNFIKGHWRLLRDTKGQLEFQKNGENNDMGIKLKLSIYDT